MDHEKNLTACIESMPSLPVSSAMAFRLCNDYFTSPSDLIRLTSLDPVLLGRLFQLANSIFAKEGQLIDSPARAIIILGMNTVKNLLLSLLPKSLIMEDKGNEHFDIYAFWQHSLGVAFTASLFAKKRGMNYKAMENFFIAGFLHDIGKLLMLTAYPELKAEENSFGIDHCQSGELICKNWGLKKDISDVIVYHHLYIDYSGEHKDILLSIAASNYFVNSFNAGVLGSNKNDIFSGICNRLNIPEDVVYKMLCDTRETVKHELERAEVYLKSAGL